MADSSLLKTYQAQALCSIHLSESLTRPYCMPLMVEK